LPPNEGSDTLMSIVVRPSSCATVKLNNEVLLGQPFQENSLVWHDRPYRMTGIPTWLSQGSEIFLGPHRLPRPGIISIDPCNGDDGASTVSLNGQAVEFSKNLAEIRSGSLVLSNNKYAELSSEVIQDFGSRDFTVKFRYRGLGQRVTPDGSYGALFIRSDQGPSPYTGPTAFLYNDGRIQFRMIAGSYNPDPCQTSLDPSSTEISNLEFRRSGGTLSIFVNLQLQCSIDLPTWNSAWNQHFISAPLRFGANHENPSIQNLNAELSNIELLDDQLQTSGCGLYPTGWCYIKVVSVDHAHGAAGQYFNFFKSEAQRMGLEDTVEVDVYHPRTNKIFKVVMWMSPNGGSSGDSHGRKTPSASAGDWQVGDTLWRKCDDDTSDFPDEDSRATIVPCDECPAGTYSSNFKLSSKFAAIACIRCKAGRFSASGTSTCTPCAAGCIRCKAGRFSASGTSTCTPCAAGKYSTLEGAAPEGSKIQIGSSVTLEEGYDGIGDASQGPMKPGDVGLVIDIRNFELGSAHQGRLASSSLIFLISAANTIFQISYSDGTFLPIILLSSLPLGLCTSNSKKEYKVKMTTREGSSSTWWYEEGSITLVKCLDCEAGTFSSTAGATSSSTCAACPTGTTSSKGAARCSSLAPPPPPPPPTSPPPPPPTSGSTAASSCQQPIESISKVGLRITFQVLSTYSREDFNFLLQRKFRQAIAAAASADSTCAIAEKNVNITRIIEDGADSGNGRHLLADGIAVDVSIAVISEEAGNALVQRGSLTKESINRELIKYELAPITEVSSRPVLQKIEQDGSRETTSDNNSLNVGGVIAFCVIFFIVVAAAGLFYWTRHHGLVYAIGGSAGGGTDDGSGGGDGGGGGNDQFRPPPLYRSSSVKSVEDFVRARTEKARAMAVRNLDLQR
jgi:hypothetical protein